MCTVEAILDRVRDPGVAALRVEGDPQGLGADAVDFDLLGEDGRIVLSAQVKSKFAPGEVISAATAFGVLARLVTECDADAYLLRCGALPGAGAAELSSRLNAGLDDDTLRRELERILRASPNGLKTLAAAPGLVGRLRRARVEFDPRTGEQLYVELKARLRSHRHAGGAGLGEHSAGLLVGYLISEILRRAGQSELAEVSMTEIRSLLLADDRDLAYAQGHRDWGLLIGAMPPVPDVERPGPFGELCTLLTRAVPRRGVRRVVLTGLSGIGKSSLAAAYIAEQAALYDVAVWVGARTSATIRAAFELAGALLGVVSDGAVSTMDDAALRGAVHAALGRLPGRWAMVFDDVPDLKTAEPWLPRHGDGDVLITTIDAVVHPSFGQRVAIGALEPAEAVDLLARRFALEKTDGELAGTLAGLARALEYWPLALELAAGYVVGCELPLAQIPQYTMRVVARALDDDASIPMGYPRTLAAALWMSRDALLERARTRSDNRPSQAMNLLYFASYLAPRQIPVDLVGAALVINEQIAGGPGGEAEGHSGPLIADDSVFSAAEVIRELRRCSLVVTEDPLPAFLDGPQGSNLTFGVNTIIQHLLRRDLELDPEQTAYVLGNLASHTDRWLHAAHEGGDLRRFSLLFTHADTLVLHLVRLGLAGGRLATLVGNTALGHAVRGAVDAAESMMRYQIEVLLGGDDAPKWQIVQARLALAGSYFRAPELSGVTRAEAMDILHQTYAEAARLAEESPEASAHLAGQAAAALAREALRGTSAEQEITRLHESFDRLLEGLLDTRMGRIVAAHKRIEQLLETGGAEAAQRAESECRSLLAKELLNASSTVETYRLLIESLVYQERWVQARAAFGEFRQSFSVGLLPPDVVAHLIHNVAGAWAIGITRNTIDPQATLLVDEILGWPFATRAMQRAQGADSARLRLIDAVHKISHSDHVTARELLALLHPEDMDEGKPEESAAWRFQLERARELCSAVASVRPVLLPQPNPQCLDDADGWFENSFVRQRQTFLLFAQLPERMEPDHVPFLLLECLAVYLDAGVDGVPTVDVALTLCRAFAHLGIAAEPRTATCKVVDVSTGRSSSLGSSAPRWREDGTFTGHCVLLLPDEARIVAPTIEIHSLVRAQNQGPASIRNLLYFLRTGQIKDAGPGVSIPRRLTFERGTLNIAIDVSHTSNPQLLDGTNPYVRERQAHYETAGRNLASAALNLLRDPRWVGKFSNTRHTRLSHLITQLQDAEVLIDERGVWRFRDKDGTAAPRTIAEL